MQFSRGEGDAQARVICDTIGSLNATELDRIQGGLNELCVGITGIDDGRCLILIDYVREDGRKKLGEDINALTHRNQLVQLERVSGIVAGVQDSFFRHLQRCRVFVHPDVYRTADLSQLCTVVQNYLESVA